MTRDGQSRNNIGLLYYRRIVAPHKILIIQQTRDGNSLTCVTLIIHFDTMWVTIKFSGENDKRWTKLETTL